MVAKSKKPRKRKGDHVVMGGKGLRCLHCGTEEELPFNAGGTSVMVASGDGYVEKWRPIPGINIKVMEAYGKEFTARHVRCKADDPRGKARFAYTSPEEWLLSWDTGVSALAIYGAFKDKSLGQLLRGPAHGNPIPYDPSDFGRCYRLLKVAPPAWSSELERVAEIHPCWLPFVAAWPELAALYEEELPSGECPKLYEAMKVLVKEAESL